MLKSRYSRFLFFRFDKLVKFYEFVNKLLTGKVLQFVFIANDWYQ